MPRELSPEFKRAIIALAPQDQPITALEIHHRRLRVPMRVVNDNDLIDPAAPLVIKRQVIEGNNYTYCRFRAGFVDDQPNQVPRAQIVIDNVGRVLTEPLNQIGGGAGATIRVMQVLRLTPSIIEWEITLDVAAVQINQLQVTVTLGFDPTLSRPAVAWTHDGLHSPGLG